MIYQQQAYASRPLSNGGGLVAITVTPSTSEMSNSSIESSSSIVINNNNNNNNNNNSINENNSTFLASKLRKIKENLENSYVSSPTPPPPPQYQQQPSQTIAVNGNYSHVQTKNYTNVFLTPNDSLTSSVTSNSTKRPGSVCGGGSSNSGGGGAVLEYSNGGYSVHSPPPLPPTPPQPIPHHHHHQHQRQSMPTFSTSQPPLLSSSSDSMSKYLQINKYQTFDFEMSNNKLSLDHILDQFDGGGGGSIQQMSNRIETSNNYDYSNISKFSNASTTTSTYAPLPKSTKNINDTPIHTTQSHTQNINEKAIDFVIPVYREIVFNPYSTTTTTNNNNNHNTNENLISATQTPIAQQMVTFKNYSNLNGQAKHQPSTVTVTGSHGNESFLKKAVYTENVSRQSSIRSLLSNISEASNPNKPVNNNNNNNDSNDVSQKVESPLFKKGAFFYSNGDLNFATNENKVNGTASTQNNLAKIKKNNKPAANGNLNTFMPVTRKEIELLNDWDTFRPSPVKIINNTTHFSQVNSNNSNSNSNNNGYGKSIQRPTTRLDLRDDIENGSNLIDSSTNFLRLVSSQSSNNNNNNKPVEYSDNVTVASSTSSGRYFQDEECESVLVTPTNEKEYFIMNMDEQQKKSKLEKHNSIGNETESVLSAFAVNNLTFEDTGCPTPNIVNKNDRKYSKGNNFF
jgi:hypothetical protein